MKAFSLDLRERVIATLTETDLSQAEIAKQFKISVPTVENWWRQWRHTASIEPQPHRGGAPRALQPYADLIREMVQHQPDATLEELCEQIESATGVHASPSMMCRELHRLQLPRKKVIAR